MPKCRQIKTWSDYERLTSGRENAKKGTHVFKEGEKCQRPNDGANSSNDIFLGRYGARCGPDSIEDIQRRGADIRVDNAYIMCVMECAGERRKRLYRGSEN